jgi:hypothetical protein
VAVVAAVYISEGGASDPRSVVSSDMRDVVASSNGAPGSPLAEDASSRMTHLYTPDDPDLPGFFSAPTRSGDACIVTSDAVISSCLRGAVPGTVSVRDDFPTDDVGPFVYGLVRPSVRGVVVRASGIDHDATLVEGFYFFKLPSSDQRAEAVQTVSFKLGNGQVFSRSLGG